MQQPGTEGVNGLHLEPARGIQRGGEQPPRMGAPRWIDFLDADALELRIEGGIVERGPARQRVEHALSHIGGGRLGEGEAEDAARRAAVEQQADHALRQHMGLAGAGIGCDPRRHERIRGLGLPVQHVKRNRTRRVHARPLSE
jgi:hypothetical protein